jgi:uncharacterized protein (UPF0297 family)
MAKTDNKTYEVKDHQLSISSLPVLLKLFSENELDRKHIGKILKITTWATLTQPLHWLQSVYIHRQLKTVNFDKTPPIFVIGHWRSGTTHLHYLLSRDPQFGYLNNYQALFMRMSFVADGIMDKVVDYYMPSTRPQDNIKMGAYEPAEEEQPLTNLTECSGMQTFFFPQSIAYFDKYNLFKGITPKEKKNWQKHYSYMLKLISLANQNKQLVLKNPHNTSRVKELLELYPNAKFIYIHRDPIAVYHSTLHLFRKMVSTQYLHDFSEKEIKERIIYAYQTTLKKYLQDRPLIPKGNLIEISYSDLEHQPIETLEKVYASLGLKGFESAKTIFTDYLSTTDDYEKNVFPPLEKEVMDRITSEWDFAFKEWNYKVPEMAY